MKKLKIELDSNQMAKTVLWSMKNDIDILLSFKDGSLWEHKNPKLISSMLNVIRYYTVEEDFNKYVKKNKLKEYLDL
jgi:hypothetical protein